MNKILSIILFTAIAFLLVHQSGLCLENASDRDRCRQQRDMACVRSNQNQKDHVEQDIQAIQVLMDKLGLSKRDFENQKRELQIALINLQAEKVTLVKEKEFLENAASDATVSATPQLSKAESLQDLKLDGTKSAGKILIAWLGISPNSLQWQHRQPSQSLSATKAQNSNLTKKENTLYAQSTEIDQQLLQVNFKLEKSGKILAEKNQQLDTCNQNIQNNCTITVCQ